MPHRLTLLEFHMQDVSPIKECSMEIGSSEVKGFMLHDSVKVSVLFDWNIRSGWLFKAIR